MKTLLILCLASVSFAGFASASETGHHHRFAHRHHHHHYRHHHHQS